MTDLEVAKSYEKYLRKPEVINLLMQEHPESSFSIGWSLTLLRAKELGLTKIKELETVGDGKRNVLGGTLLNDKVWGRADDDVLSGKSGDDLLYGEAGGMCCAAARLDSLHGGDGNDTLSERRRRRRGLHGEADRDIYIGASGNDTLKGGEGRDDSSAKPATTSSMAMPTATSSTAATATTPCPELTDATTSAAKRATTASTAAPGSTRWRAVSATTPWPAEPDRTPSRATTAATASPAATATTP